MFPRDIDDVFLAEYGISLSVCHSCTYNLALLNLYEIWYAGYSVRNRELLYPGKWNSSRGVIKLFADGNSYFTILYGYISEDTYIIQYAVGLFFFYYVLK